MPMVNFAKRANVISLTANNADYFSQYTLRNLTAYLCQVSSQWGFLDTRRFKERLDALAPLPGFSVAFNAQPDRSNKTYEMAWFVPVHFP